jgi:FMN-dependent NADH-azoreductase
MNILRINCSPKQHQSISYQLSERIIDAQHKSKINSDWTLTDVDALALPHVDSEYAILLTSRTSSPVIPSGSNALSEHLIKQLTDADAVIIATPMHNYTVPSSLKSWIDHVVRIGKTFIPTAEGKVGTLTDKPVYIAVASGGLYRSELAQQPDFLTAYLKTVLATIGLKNIHFFVIEGTVLGDDHLEAEFSRVQSELDSHFSA